MSWLSIRRTITIFEGLSIWEKRSINTTYTHTFIQLGFFLLHVSLRFFGFLFIHSIIPQHAIGGDCVDNDLYSAFLFFFIFILALIHTRLYRRAQWILILINRSASCISTKSREHFVLHLLWLLSYHISTSYYKMVLNLNMLCGSTKNSSATTKSRKKIDTRFIRKTEPIQKSELIGIIQLSTSQ